MTQAEEMRDHAAWLRSVGMDAVAATFDAMAADLELVAEHGGAREH